MKSILQKEKECYLCGDNRLLESHHIFFGTANRNLMAGTILEKITYLQQSKEMLKNAINFRWEGVIDHNTPFRAYADVVKKEKYRDGKSVYFATKCSIQGAKPFDCVVAPKVKGKGAKPFDVCICTVKEEEKTC